MEPEYEKIAALKPDLILDVKSSGDQARYDRLKSIATTIGVPQGGDSYLTSQEQQVTMIATALGEKAKGEALLKRGHPGRLRGRRAAHPDWKGKTMTAATKTAEAWGAYIEGSERVTFMQNLGFVQNPTIAAMKANASGFSVSLSPENLDQIDADVIVAFPIFIKTDQLTGDAAWKAIPAVKDGRAVVIDGDLARPTRWAPRWPPSTPSSNWCPSWPRPQVAPPRRAGPASRGIALGGPRRRSRESPAMRFLFLGAGAIGTYVGGSLAAAGEDVTFIERPETAAVIAEHGLKVHTADTTRVVRDVTVHGSAAEALAHGPYDIGVFALKSFDTQTALDELVATGHEVPSILSLQNGVDNEPTIAATLGAGKVIAGTVATAVSKPGVGEVVEEKHRGIGVALGHPLSEPLVAALDRAELSGRAFRDARRDEVVEAADQPDRQRDVRDSGRNGGPVVRRPAHLRHRVGGAARMPGGDEGQGHRVVDLPGTPVRALALATRLPRFIAQPALTKALGSGRGDKMPSFHIDLHGGRGRTEVGFLNGAVARAGAEAGVPTPVNALLTDTLEALSAGDLPLNTYRHDPDALLARLP